MIGPSGFNQAPRDFHTEKNLDSSSEPEWMRQCRSYLRRDLKALAVSTYIDNMGGTKQDAMRALGLIS